MLKLVSKTFRMNLYSFDNEVINTKKLSTKNAIYL